MENIFHFPFSFCVGDSSFGVGRRLETASNGNRKGNEKWKMRNGKWKMFSIIPASCRPASCPCRLRAAAPSCHLPLPPAYWFVAVLRGASGIKVISIRRFRARPAPVAFDPNGLEAPIPVA
jgi:hypothetical protein